MLSQAANAEWGDGNHTLIALPFEPSPVEHHREQSAAEATTEVAGFVFPVNTTASEWPALSIERVRAAMSADELHDYWARKNVTSIDGFATNIFADEE